MSEVSQSYLSKIYVVLALDPVHIGTGEHKLGAVDNPIVREPSTNLPKLPGTSMNGALRSYITLYYSDRFMRDQSKNTPANCAEDATLRFCCQPTCPVCVIFGFPQGEKGYKGFTSMAQIFDAHILFFPVNSMIGPVWVTSIASLKAAADSGLIDLHDTNIRISTDSNDLQTSLKNDKLSLGWLLLKVKEISAPLNDHAKEALKRLNVPAEILDHLILVSDKLFSHVVNSNMEIRTSNAIDPVTGSTREGALFTYEAIPRSTLFWLSITYKDPRNFLMEGEKIEFDLQWVKENIERGMSFWEHLGVGGMSTRGMGRVKVLNLE